MVGIRKQDVIKLLLTPHYSLLLTHAAPHHVVLAISSQVRPCARRVSVPAARVTCVHSCALCAARPTVIPDPSCQQRNSATAPHIIYHTSTPAPSGPGSAPPTPTSTPTPAGTCTLTLRSRAATRPFVMCSFLLTSQWRHAAGGAAALAIAAAAPCTYSAQTRARERKAPMPTRRNRPTQPSRTHARLHTNSLQKCTYYYYHGNF